MSITDTSEITDDRYEQPNAVETPLQSSSVDSARGGCHRELAKGKGANLNVRSLKLDRQKLVDNRRWPLHYWGGPTAPRIGAQLINHGTCRW